MRAPYAQLYLHLVWATWDRLPRITPELQPRIYSALHAHGTRLNADVLAIGGMSDHVHLLVRFPTTISISDLVQKLKGASSHLVTHVIRHPDPFKWQGGYGAFTLSRSLVPRVRAYVLNQERHHREGTLSRSLERTQEEASS